jgi:hypothetical protein
MICGRRAIFIVVIVSAAAISCVAAYFGYVRDSVGSDEFAVYEAFLSHLSAEIRVPPNTFALADKSSKLVASTPDSWIPKELLPYPPEKADPPVELVSFCGSWCGHEFMKRNLKSWSLKPDRKVHFSFDVVPASVEAATTKREKYIVSVTRPGFDMWHHRAVVGYSFDCSSGGTQEEIGAICLQMGHVLLEKADGVWQVKTYTATVL